MSDFNDKATVSGSVVSIENGADEVGAKSCVVTVSPTTLSGVSSVTEKQTGRNLANIGAVESCTNTSGTGSSITQNNDGSITIVTTTQQNVKCLQKFSDIFPNVKVGQTCILSATTTGTQKQIYLHGVSTVWTFGQSKTITEEMLTSDVSFYASGNNTTATVSDFMLEYGSTAHDYESYQTPTQYTASLGRTIYGGQVDIVNGEGQETYPNIKISDLTFVKDTNCQHTFRCTNLSRKYGSGVYNILSSAFTTYTSGNSTGSNIASLEVGHDNTIFLNGGSATFYITADSSYNNKSASDFVYDFANTLLIYEASTPTDFTFDGQEVPTRLGYNAFWSEQGDTELTYYKSGYGFTSITVHKETPDGEPVEQTAKLHKVIYGGEVDVIRGTAKPKNLIDDSKRGYAGGNIYFGHSSGTAYDFSVRLKKGTYTYSVVTADGTTTNLYVRNSDTNTAISGFPAYNVLSKTFTLDEDTNIAVWVYKGGYTSVTDITSAQIESGSPSSDYAPHFEPFTFPPISMETDEGENTLYANEGDSAIIYRKQAE